MCVAAPFGAGTVSNEMYAMRAGVML
jgi:hypothetical protein